MKKRPFGKTGLQVSVLGFGGSEIGYTDAKLSNVEQMLNSALDAGLNVIDTAECYVTSEELIGHAVSHRRKDFYLFSKCGHSHGYGDPDWNDQRRLQESLDRSLNRLRTDYLDLFQLHTCSKEILQKGDVIDFMKRAKESGKVRFIGYSGDGEAALYAIQSGAFDALQTSINIADQEALDLTIPEAVRKGLGIIAKRPIVSALWRQKKRPDDYYVAYWERLKQLDYEFTRQSSGADIETALRFTLSVPGVSVAIVGTQKPGRWQENALITAKGALSSSGFQAIRQRWKERSQADWIGQA